MSKVKLDKIAYEPHPVTAERKRELNGRGYKIIDARFAPADAEPAEDELRNDGPTVEEYVAAGYPAAIYPPQGYASRSTPEEIAAAVAAQAANGKIDLGTDSGDQISEDELRKVIAQETGKAPHPAAKYETLVAKFNELNQKAAQEVAA